MTTLDFWCALNSSAGGPLLALVTIGGVLAAGRSLISFPKASEGGPIADRNKKNRFRALVLILGILTLIFLAGDVLAYVYAFSETRSADKVCVASLSATGLWAVNLFFLSAGGTAFVGLVYAFFLAKLKE